MNTKFLRVVTVSIFTVISGLALHQAVAHASNQPIASITDDDVAHDRQRLCGTSEETSNACQGHYRACTDGISDIEDNMYEGCRLRPGNCSYDVVHAEMPASMLDALYDAPIESYANSAEVFNLNACRSQHPKSEDATIHRTPEEEAKLKIIEENMRRAELGLPPLEENAPAADVPVNNNADVAQAVPVVQADAVDNAAQANAGGCSFGGFAASASPSCIAMLLMAMSALVSTRICARRK